MTVRHFPEPQRSGARLMYIIESTGSSLIRVAVPFTAKRFSSIHIPPWENVYRTFRRWAAGDKFEQMHDRLRDLWRSREERAPEPTAAVLDAQSTRSSPQGGPSGYDAGKKVKGRKRNLVVDTLGLLLMVSVVPANVQDRPRPSSISRAPSVRGSRSVPSCFGKARGDPVIEPTEPGDHGCSGGDTDGDDSDQHCDPFSRQRNHPPAARAREADLRSCSPPCTAAPFSLVLHYQRSERHTQGPVFLPPSVR